MFMFIALIILIGFSMLVIWMVPIEDDYGGVIKRAFSFRGGCKR